MMSVEYDLDTSGGLMPQIQALIAPPVSDDCSKAKKKEGKDLHPYYKRPGKGHNHDCCDACGEGGDLLCCDKCPASFHFQCHDPPLDEADLPIGEWLCHCCRVAAACAGSKNADVKPSAKEGAARGRLRCKRELEPPAAQRPRPDPMNPLQLLLHAAASLNPRQFELPRELGTSLPFPGTDKNVGSVLSQQQQRSASLHRAATPQRAPAPRRATAVKKKPHELDNGMVSLPAKVCYECRRSCRKAPLVACDYCPLLFHPDCLDPPLASLPTGHWMCPNHSEHFLDSALLTSCSASERIRLWDRYTGPVDQDAVKVEFIRKARRQNPPFRVRVRLAPRNTVRVPDAVKAQYAHPPCLVPSLRDVLREQEALSSLQHREHSASTGSPLDQPLGALASLQASATCQLTARCVEPDVRLNGEVSPGLVNGEVHWDAPPRHSCGGKPDRPGPAGGVRRPLQPSKALAQLQVLLGMDMERPLGSADLSRLDTPLVHLLALQRLHQLLPEPGSDPEPPREPPGPGAAPPLPGAQPCVRARAVLCPLTSRITPCAMPYRTLSVGTGADNDLVLGRFGHCNYVSPHHAAIFFDETTQHFELINYSEHGTTVDNVLFSCDFSDKPAAREGCGESKEATAMVLLAASVRAEVDRRRGVQPAPPTPPALRMAGGSGREWRRCCCRASGSSVIGGAGAGWEGTALLAHGSYIRFGCLQFVFSVTGHALTGATSPVAVKHETNAV